MSKLYDGIVELELAPPVLISSLIILHSHLKKTPNIDVLNVKGSIDEGITVRMLIRTPTPLLGLIKGVVTIKDVSDNSNLVQSQTEDGVKRIIVKTI
jgi:hypothetical protein